MPIILQIAIAPLRQQFDYLAPADCEPGALAPGVRVRVPFRNRETIGILLAHSETSTYHPARLKQAITILDRIPVLSPTLLQLAQWASQYYHHPLSDVLLCTLPTLLRQGQAPSRSLQRYYQLTAEGHAVDLTLLSKRARQQATLLSTLKQHGMPMCKQQLNAADIVASALTAAIKKGWVHHTEQPVSLTTTHQRTTALQLNPEQQRAVTAVCASVNTFQSFLLHGVTGSGKTEVYLQIVAQVIASGRQALLLVPEINLTPQLVARFQQRFATPIAVLHSHLTDRERLDAWVLASDGTAPIIIGTRLAIFTPLKQPGVIILDEEHDSSFKQQEGFRYSARDLAVVRAQLESIPIVMGSATPSLESLHNARQNRYQLLNLPERAGNATHPSFHLLDIRNQPLNQGLSPALLQAIERHLSNHGQVLVFLNRRGFSPCLICHACGWVAQCRRCDARLTLHLEPRHLHCHHCSASQALCTHCPQCQSPQLLPLGLGTERLEQALAQYFPQQTVVRIDRDTVRRKGDLQRKLDQIHSGHGRILVGTQMLAKGHHFPDVTLVAVVNADSGLYSADFRASERTAQLLLQVAGRAGRAERPGEVLIQTHNPSHPLLLRLIESGYLGFAELALAERQQAQLPPHGYVALVRADATQKNLPLEFLQQLKTTIQKQRVAHLQVLGPIPAPMEKRAGRYRSQLLLQATKRSVLQSLLQKLIKDFETLKSSKRVRWSLDVDPVDLF